MNYEAMRNFARLVVYIGGLITVGCTLIFVFPSRLLANVPAARDPGVQHTDVTNSASCPNSTKPPFDPAPIEKLSAAKLLLFCAGLKEFRKADTYADDGLGPTMNLDSCMGCHAYPTTGGSSPPHTVGNPQLLFLRLNPTSKNVAPSFITADGPVREARFIRTPSNTPDGGVHAIFTVAGLPGAEKCKLAQPDFQKEQRKKNVIFRIPTPLFGTGLIEQIEDREIRQNLGKNSAVQYGADYGLKSFSIKKGHLNSFKEGHVAAFRESVTRSKSTRKNTGEINSSDNDGTIARFGWKAQNKSLLVFAGEAYNVEMGISNELFETERNETSECQSSNKQVPNDTTDPDKLACAIIKSNEPKSMDCDDTDPKKVLAARYDAYSDIEKFAAFIRYLAPPRPSSEVPGGAVSIGHGREIFKSIGCANCHTPELHTSTHSAGGPQPVRLFSDLALHDMGSRLADGVTQGRAGPRDFRSAPLWGLSGREFLLHDGRATNLIDAINSHYSKGIPEKGGSEANDVVRLFKSLAPDRQQDLLNFLRSL